MNWRRGAARVALTAAVGAGVAAAAPQVTEARDARSPEQVVVLDIRHSRFISGELRFAAGTTVRFIVRNADPIPHELIVGDATVHQVHERGTEAHHGAKSGEVSVPPGGEAETTYTFGSSGQLLFGCHLPGHWAYGMHGVIQVT